MRRVDDVASITRSTGAMLRPRLRIAVLLDVVCRSDALAVVAAAASLIEFIAGDHGREDRLLDAEGHDDAD